MLRRNPFRHPAVAHRKDAWIRTGGFDQSVWPASDYDMWFKLGKEGQMVNLPEVITNVRVHKGAGTHTHHKLMARKAMQVRWHAWKKLGYEMSALDVAVMGISIVGAELIPVRVFEYFYNLVRVQKK